MVQISVHDKVREKWESPECRSLTVDKDWFEDVSKICEQNVHFKRSRKGNGREINNVELKQALECL